MDTFERMLTRLRGGRRVEEPGPGRPRWTAGESLSPALRQTHLLHCLISAVSLDDTYAWALAGDSVHRIPRDGGEPQRLQLEGKPGAFYWKAVFGGGTLTAIDGERVLVWDLATGALRLATDPDDIPRRAGDLCSLAIGNGTAVTGTDEGYLLQWRLADGRLLARRAVHGGYVSATAISTDGTILSAGAGKLCFSDLDGLRLISEVAGTADIATAGWTALGGERRAMTVDDGGVVNVWDPATAGLVGHFHTTTRPRSAPAFLADGRAVLAERSALRIVDLRDGTVPGTVRADFGGHADEIAVHGSFVLAAEGSSSEGRINLLELTDPLPRDAPDRSHFLDAIATTIGGRAVIVAQEQLGSLEVFDAADGQRLEDLGGGVDLGGGYPRLQHLPGSLAVLIRLAPTTVDLATGATRTAGEPLTPTFLSAAATGGGLIAAVDLGGAIGVWEAATLTLRARTTANLDPTSMAIAGLDGRPVVLVGTDGGGIRWFDGSDLAEISPPGLFAGRTGPADHESDGMDRPGPRAVRRLDLFGATLLSAEGSNVVCSDIASGEPAGPVLAHPDRVWEIRPATVGGVPLVATGCADNHLRIWEIETGRLIWSAEVPQRIFRILSVTADQVVVLVRGYLIAIER
ncbi:hypothetical protein [Actinoplanes sp. NPDC026619]|uniref:WD40 repeat domain-containing protein n=1 Tax=Actinoplanes sp. NPDC026619 TaxID=3155798 RepID=UPI0034116A02